MIEFKEYVISNETIRLTILIPGCILKKVEINNNGQWQNMVLGFEDNNLYENSPFSVGQSLIGRFAGRIEDGEFEVNGKKIKLDINCGNHHIHGGEDSYDKLEGNVKIDGNQFIFKTFDIGNLYPGDIELLVTFNLEKYAFTQEIKAISTEDTIFNPTNHTFFNFDPKNDVMDYVLKIDSDYCYYVDEEDLPDKLMKIENSCFKGMNNGIKLNELNREDKQLKMTKFLNHPFHLKGNITLENKNYALKITTNQNFVVVYTANHLGSINNYLNGQPAVDFMGICLEAQAIPNAININEYKDDVILKKGIAKTWSTNYAFKIK